MGRGWKRWVKEVGCSPGLRGLDPGDERWQWVIWSSESVINLGEQAGHLLYSPGELSVGRRTQERRGGEGGAWSPPVQHPCLPSLLAVLWPQGCCTGSDCRLGLETWRLRTAQPRTAPLW